MRYTPPMRVWMDWEMPRNGAMQMALDEMLWKEASEPILRLYTWSQPTLSLGRHQRRHKVNQSQLQRHGINLVRRPTGGKAVLHHQELTYSLCAGYQTHSALTELRSGHQFIAQCLARGLGSLGLEAQLSDGRVVSPVKGPMNCFAVPSKAEVVVNGKKVIGSAQARGKKSLLEHGAIPLRLDWTLWEKAMGPEVNSQRESFASLEEVGWANASLGALATALAKAFGDALGGEHPWEPSPRWIREAERLAKDVYESPGWTWDGDR